MFPRATRKGSHERDREQRRACFRERKGDVRARTDQARTAWRARAQGVEGPNERVPAPTSVESGQGTAGQSAEREGKKKGGDGVKKKGKLPAQRRA